MVPRLVKLIAHARREPRYGCTSMQTWLVPTNRVCFAHATIPRIVRDLERPRLRPNSSASMTMSISPSRA
jgi:hypothetical protein